MSTRRRSIGPIAVVAAVMSLAFGALGVGPAAAAPNPIGLSYNGITFGPTLDTALFSDLRIVPGSTITRSFWVKNQESSTGNLALVIGGVSSADGDLLENLTIAADIGDGSGAPIGLSEVGTCATLLKAIPLPAGATTRINVSLDLAPALTGLQAQGAVGAFDLTVSLTSDVVSAPDGCGALPPAPRPPGSIGSHASKPALPGTATFPGLGSTAPIHSGTPGVEAPLAPEPETSPETDLPGDIGNTDRFYQEITVMLWVVGLLVGGLLAWGRARRRERIRE